MAHTCLHRDEEDGSLCGNPAKEEYGHRYCGIHKVDFYVEQIDDLKKDRDNALDKHAIIIQRMRLEHEQALARHKSYTSKESKISTALLWVGSLSAAAFAGAMATYLIMM